MVDVAVADPRASEQNDPAATPTTNTLALHLRRRRQTCFLDLPRELRDIIYIQVLQNNGRKMIKFKYDCDYTPEYEERQGKHVKSPNGRNVKPPHSGIYAPILHQKDVLGLRSARWKERLPPLALASAQLRHEVLTTYYKLNTFSMHLRNFIDRRLCAQWIHTRGTTLEYLNHFEPYDIHIYQHNESAQLRAHHIIWYERRFSGPQLCSCSFEDWFNKYRDTDIARGICGHRLPEGLDEHGVAGTLLRICELQEAAQRIRNTIDANLAGKGFKGMWSDRHTTYVVCQLCGKNQVGWRRVFENANRDIRRSES